MHPTSALAMFALNQPGGTGMGGVIRAYSYIVIFVLCTIAVVAQPRLDVRSLPAPSVAFQLMLADTVGIKAGAAGPNVTWDFNGLQRTGGGSDLVAIQYMSRSQTPPQAAALFPTAQVAVRTGTRYEFFRTEGAMFRSLGEWSPSSSLTSGTANPYDTRPVEITYSGQHVDQYKAVLTTVTPPSTQQRAGNHTFVYDGYGTLRLPSGAVVGVARTRTTTSTTDTARITSPLPQMVLTFTDTDTYRWSSVNSNVPWLTISNKTVRVTTNGLPTSTVSTREVLFRDTTNIPSGVDEEYYNSRLYPNPVHVNEDVVVSGVNAEFHSAELIDLQGHVTVLPFVHSDNATTRVRIVGVAAGTYTLLLRSVTGVLQQRIVVLP